MSFWFVGDEECEDPRFREAGIAACGLYFTAGAWCMRQVRGRQRLPAKWFVPDHFVRSWPNGARTAGKLVKAGLWERVDGGYGFAWIRRENQPAAIRAKRDKELAKWERKQARKRRSAFSTIPGGDQ